MPMHELMEKYEERELYFLAILVYYRDYSTCNLIRDFFDDGELAQFPLCSDLCTLLDSFLKDNWHDFRPGSCKLSTKFMISAEEYIRNEVEMRNFASQNRYSDISSIRTDQLLTNSTESRKMIKLKGYNFEYCDLSGENFFINVICRDLNLNTMDFVAESLNYALQFQEICELGWLRDEHFRESNQKSYDAKTLPEVKAHIYSGICKYLYFALEPDQHTPRTLHHILRILCKNVPTIDSLMTEDDIGILVTIVEHCLKVDYTESLILLRDSEFTSAITKYYNIFPLSAKLELKQLYAISPPGFDYMGKFDKVHPPNSLLDLGQRAKRIIHSRSLIASANSPTSLNSDNLFKKCYVIEGSDEIWSVATGPGYFLVGKYSEDESLVLYVISDQGIPVKVESVINIGPVRHIREAGRNKFIVKTVEKLHEVIIEVDELRSALNGRGSSTEGYIGSFPRAERTLDPPQITIHNLFAFKEQDKPFRLPHNTETITLNATDSESDFSDSDNILTDSSAVNTGESDMLESETEENELEDSDNDDIIIDENASETTDRNTEDVDDEGFDEDEDEDGDGDESHENTLRNMPRPGPMESRMIELRNIIKKDKDMMKNTNADETKGEKSANIPNARLVIKDFKPDWPVRQGTRIIDAFRVCGEHKSGDEGNSAIITLVEELDNEFVKSYTIEYGPQGNDEFISYKIQNEPVSIAFSESDILVLPLKTVHSHQTLTVLRSYPPLSKDFVLPHLPQDRMQYNTLVASIWDPRVIVLLSPPNRIYIFDKNGKRSTLCIQGPKFGNNIMDVKLVGPFDRFIVVTSDDADHNVFIYDRFTLKEIYRINEHEELINTVAAYLPHEHDITAKPFLLLGGEQGSIYCYCDPI